MQASQAPAKVTWGHAKPERLIGRVRRLIPQGPYGFIYSDGGENFYFHLCDTNQTKLPAVGSIVRFTAARHDILGKNPRALHVEVL